MRALVARAPGWRTHRARLRRHRRLARRQPPDPRATAAARARGSSSRRGARDERERLRAVRPGARDGPREPAPSCGAGPRRAARAKVRLLREFDPASAGARTSTFPIPTTAARAASRRCSISCRPRATGCSSAARARCRGRAARRMSAGLPPGASDARRVGGGDINEAWRVTLADGREAFVKTRAGAAPRRVRRRGRRPALAGGARRAAHAARARGRRATTWCSSGSSRDAWTRGRRGARPRARAHARRRRRALRRAAGEARRAARPASARCGCPTSPRADWPSFYAERRLRPLARHRARTRRAGRGRRSRAVERVCERLRRAVRPARAAGAPARRPVVGQRDGRRARAGRG